MSAELELQLAHHGVGELAGVLDGLHGQQHLGRDPLLQLHVGVEGGVDLPDQRVQFHQPILVGLCLDQIVNLHHEKIFGLHERTDDGPAFSLHQHFHRAIG